jgi:hypothetical protein
VWLARTLRDKDSDISRINADFTKFGNMPIAKSPINATMLAQDERKARNSLP